MNSELQTAGAQEVLTAIAPATPPSEAVALDTNNQTATLFPPIPSANESIENMAPLETTENDKSLADAEPTKTLADYAKAILEAHQNAENADRLSKKSGRE